MKNATLEFVTNYRGYNVYRNSDGLLECFKSEGGAFRYSNVGKYYQGSNQGQRSF